MSNDHTSSQMDGQRMKLQVFRGALCGQMQIRGVDTCGGKGEAAKCNWNNSIFSQLCCFIGSTVSLTLELEGRRGRGIAVSPTDDGRAFV